jgi:hypothetical protein
LGEDLGILCAGLAKGKIVIGLIAIRVDEVIEFALDAA